MKGTPGRPRFELTADEEASVADGARTPLEVATARGVTVGTVYRALKRAGVSWEKSDVRRAREANRGRFARVARLRAAGTPIARIAAEVNLCVSGVVKMLKRGW